MGFFGRIIANAKARPFAIGPGAFGSMAPPAVELDSPNQPSRIGEVGAAPISSASVREPARLSEPPSVPAQHPESSTASRTHHRSDVVGFDSGEQSLPDPPSVEKAAFALSVSAPGPGGVQPREIAPAQEHQTPVRQHAAERSTVSVEVRSPQEDRSEPKIEHVDTSDTPSRSHVSAVSPVEDENDVKEVSAPGARSLPAVEAGETISMGNGESVRTLPGKERSTDAALFETGEPTERDDTRFSQLEKRERQESHKAPFFSPFEGVVKGKHVDRSTTTKSPYSPFSKGKLENSPFEKGGRGDFQQSGAGDAHNSKTWNHVQNRQTEKNESRATAVPGEQTSHKTTKSSTTSSTTENKTDAAPTRQREYRSPTKIRTMPTKTADPGGGATLAPAAPILDAVEKVSLSTVSTPSPVIKTPPKIKDGGKPNHRERPPAVLHIGQIDVIVEARPSPTERAPAAPSLPSDMASRLYLKRV